MTSYELQVWNATSGPAGWNERTEREDEKRGILTQNLAETVAEPVKTRCNL